MEEDKKKLCHCHNEMVYQFVECPNCKANFCLKGISDAKECQFCGIMFIKTTNLMRQTKQKDDLSPYQFLSEIDQVPKTQAIQQNNGLAMRQLHEIDYSQKN